MKKSTKLSLAVIAASVGLVTFGPGAPATADVNPPLAALGEPTAPADNKQTPAKVELGKLLYFDARIGGDASVACVDCHMPKQGWGFNDPISRGYPGAIHWRNSQTVINTAYLSKLFWTGSAKSLEAQAPSAALGALSGNGERDMVEARLAFIPEYVKRFKDVFGDRWPKVNNVWKAMAAFERILIHNNTFLATERAVVIRGTPEGQCEVKRNWFPVHESESLAVRASDKTTVHDNLYGGNEIK